MKVSDACNELRLGMVMNPRIQALILKATGAQAAVQLEIVQRLWSGYGEIVRYGLTGGDRTRVIVKYVKLSGQGRRSQNDLSHRRKVRSYQVETVWYGQWSRHCDADCRVPACLAFEAHGDEIVLVLEDLDAAGFPERRPAADKNRIRACLSWLAHFHATFIGEPPAGLWPIGTYWHLATRPDELEALNDTALKNAASAIDQALRASPYQTLVHGVRKSTIFAFPVTAGASRRWISSTSGAAPASRMWLTLSTAAWTETRANARKATGWTSIFRR
jgi:hypothetical protein